MVYLARTLGADLYGIIAFSAAVLIYLSRIADGGIDLGLGVREMAADSQATIALAPAILTARLVISVVLALALGAIALVTLPHPDGAVLATFGLTLIPVAASTRWIHLGLERTRAVAAARAIGEALMVVLVFALVRGRNDLLAAPIAQFAGDSLAAALLLCWIAKRGVHLRVTFDWNDLRPLAARSWPLVGSALLGLLIYNSDFLFLRVFRDRAAVGLYAAAYTLVSFLLNMGAAYNMSLLPRLTKTSAVRADHHGLYHMATAHVFAVSLPIAVGGSLLAARIITLVFGGGYGPSAIALSILMWTIPVCLLRDVPVMTLLAWGREDRVLHLTAWAAAVGLALNLILIPSYGLIGAAIASVATESIRMVLALAAVRRFGFALTEVKRFLKPVVAGFVMAAVLVVASPPTIWMALALGTFAYVVCLSLLGGITFARGAIPSLNV